MWVEPNGTVRLLTGVPFNVDYENTLYFPSRTAQYNYFISKTKVHNGISMIFPKVSYQRYQRNYIKLEVNSEAIYDCNYLMFQNTNFGDRWFYAFITEIEYVANAVTRIEYVIDDMQTWFPDCTLHDSFVERQHPVTDVFGANRVEENIEYGDYLLDALTPSMYAANHPYMDEQVIVVACDKVWGGQQISNLFHVYKGIGSGLVYYVYPMTESGVGGVNYLIQTYTSAVSTLSQDDIIAIFMCPKVFFLDYNVQPTSGPGGFDWYSTLIQSDQTLITEPRHFTYSLSIPTALHNYTPRNKKLLQYPYNFLFVTDGRSNTASYRYEYFNSVNANFEYYMSPSTDSSMVIYPKDYKGVSGENIAEKMVFKGFPICSWSCDMWQAYIAQNGGVFPSVMYDAIYPISEMTQYGIENNSSIMRGLNSGFNNAIRRLGGAEIITDANERARLGNQGNITQISTLPRLLATLGRNIGHTKVGNQANGNFNGDILYASGIYDFQYGQMCLTAEYSQKLDRFFDLYGYKTANITTVNTHSRNHWNYVKTVGLNMTSPIPQDSADNIIKIFENGIRFWKDPSDNCTYTESLAFDNVGYATT